MKLIIAFSMFYLYFFYSGPGYCNDVSREAAVQPFGQISLEWAEKGNNDSADFYMKKAYSNGMSDDSLFYIWAQISVKKGSLDTALALNYASKPDTNTRLYRLILEQRYTIYSALGWEKDADEILDLLKRQPSEKLKLFIPEFSVSLSGGFVRENVKNSGSYPYREPYDTIEVFNRPDLTFSSGAKWVIPINPFWGLKLGTQYDLKNYNKENQNIIKNIRNTGDSLDHTFRLETSCYLFSGMLSFDYSWSRQKDYFSDVYCKNRFGSKLVFLKDSWMTFVNAGYTRETQDPSNTFYGLVYFENFLSEKKSISFLVNSMWVDFKTMKIPLTPVYLLFANKDTFIFYKDSTFTDAYEFSIQDKKLYISNYILPDAYTTSHFKIPQSYFSLTPSVSFKREMRWGIEGAIGIVYNLLRYSGNYEWMDFKYSSDYIEGNFIPEGLGVNDLYPMLTMSQDGYKYWLREIVYEGYEIIVDSIPIEYHSKKRMDHTFSVNTSLSKSVKEQFEITLSADLSKTYSSLHEYAIVDIPKWSYEIALACKYTFDPARLKGF